MKEEYRTFAHNLTLYMNYHGYNNTRLANALSVAPAAVTWWTQGKRLPRFGKMRELTNLFQCTQDDLFDPNTTEETISFKIHLKRLNDSVSRLNADGIEKALQYVKDLNSKYYKNDRQS